MKNILVFGGTRFMGKHTVTELLSKGHQVTIATRGIAPDPFGDQVSRITVDRTDAASMNNALQGSDYDVIIDSLAYAPNEVRHLLDSVKCSRYVQISSSAVYSDLHTNTCEKEFSPDATPFTWFSRNDHDYAESKRQAECCIAQKYSDTPSVMIRFPFVIGPDDYTERLDFYIRHTIHQIPMFIDNIDTPMAFVRSDEAGRFAAFLADSTYCGSINGASEQTISLKEILDYVNLITNKTPVISPNGEPAPYNNLREYSLNIDRSKSLGYEFTPLKDWIYELIDFYIEKASCI